MSNDKLVKFLQIQTVDFAQLASAKCCNAQMYLLWLKIFSCVLHKFLEFFNNKVASSTEISLAS